MLGQDNIQRAIRDFHADQMSEQSSEAVGAVNAPFPHENVMSENYNIGSLPTIEIKGLFQGGNLPFKIFTRIWHMNGREYKPFMPATRLWPMNGRAVHGACELPEGYALLILPGDTPASRLEQSTPNQAVPTKKGAYHVDGISMSYNLSNAVIALFQTIYASFTLYYGTRGDQIKRFGYAAFGLTSRPIS
jgi:hypothetical protein